MATVFFAITNTGRKAKGLLVNNDLEGMWKKRAWPDLNTFTSGLFSTWSSVCYLIYKIML
jgi:hypothetical protein